jgi:hypothetical protein
MQSRWLKYGINPVKKLLRPAANVGDVYRLDQAAEQVNVTAVTLQYEVWHRRLGHLNRKSINLLQRGVASGINSGDNTKQCIACIEGKQCQKPFKKGKAKRAKDKLELIHSDLCGPMSETSWGGSLYLLTSTDDFTRKTFGYFLKSKDEVKAGFEEFQLLVENQTGKKLRF